VALLYPSAFSCPLAVDGRVGQYTIGRVRSICLNADMAGRLVMFMLGHRIAFYDDLIRKNPKLQVFQKGWTARVANLGKYLEKIPAEVA
jgi:lysozyme family protein